MTLSFVGGQDIADNADNALSNTAPTGTNDSSYVVDNTAPTVAITGVPPTSTAAFTATFTFSEAVTGFVVGDITLGNATASSITATSTTVLYDADHADGQWCGDGGTWRRMRRRMRPANGNTAAAQASSTYTMPVPTITIAAGTTPRHRGRVGGLHADPVRGAPG